MIDTNEKPQDKTSNPKRKKNWKEYIVPILLTCIVIELGIMIGTSNSMSFYLKYIFHDVSSLKSDVASIQSDISSIKSDVYSLEYDVGSIRSDVSSIESYAK